MPVYDTDGEYVGPSYKMELEPEIRRDLMLALAKDKNSEYGTAENWRALAFELADGCLGLAVDYGRGYAKCLETMKERDCLMHPQNVDASIARLRKEADHYEKKFGDLIEMMDGDEDPKPPVKRCRKCGGDGFVEIQSGPYTRKCDACDGTGIHHEKTVTDS